VVTAGQPLATLVNPTLKLDVLTREAEIASQLGTLTGDELSLERSRLDRAAQTASANYDLLKARRDTGDPPAVARPGFVSDEGVKSYQEEAEYQHKRLGQLRAGQDREDRTAGLQASRLADTRARLTGNLAAVRAGLDALVVRAGHRPARQSGDPAGADPRGRRPRGAGRWRGRLETGGRRGRISRPRCRGQQAKGEAGIALVVSKVLPAVANGRFHIELGFAGQPPGPQPGPDDGHSRHAGRDQQGLGGPGGRLAR
jgi:HlyD family secretion protein